MRHVLSFERPQPLFVLVVIGLILVSVGFTSVYLLSSGEVGLFANTPEDPENDVIGWEDGYWHNESIGITGDSLDEDELDAVIARSKARLEVVRGFEYTASPDVNVISRAEYKQQYSNETHTEPSYRVSENVKYEALFLISQQKDAIKTLDSDSSEVVDGYYDFSTKNITLITDTSNGVKVDENVLLQELYHAHQDTKYDIGSWETRTTDSRIARLSVIEGDAVLVSHYYKQRYDDFVVQTDTGTTGNYTIHHGVYVMESAPYNAGSTYVSHIKNQSGWSGVNDLYESPPTQSATILEHTTPPKGTDTKINITTSLDNWVVVSGENGPVNDSIGAVGLYAMMWYPSHLKTPKNSPPETVVIPYDHFYKSPDGLDSRNYSHEVTSGLVEDKLVIYTKPRINETAYVWKLLWDSDSDAREFTTSYKTLLSYYGGEKTTETTFKIYNDDYTGVYGITRDGKTVTIVKTPTE